MKRRSSLAVIVLAGGLLWGCDNWGELQDAYEPRAWPTTSGVVTESKVVDSVIGVNVGRYGHIWPQIITRLDLRYEYTVAGQAYVGTQWNRWPLLANHYVLHESKRYPVRAAVTVHYNPRDPSSAVLDTSLPAGTVTDTVLGFVVAAIAAGYLLRPRRSRR